MVISVGVKEPFPSLGYTWQPAGWYPIPTQRAGMPDAGSTPNAYAGFGRHIDLYLERRLQLSENVFLRWVLTGDNRCLRIDPRDRSLSRCMQLVYQSPSDEKWLVSPEVTDDWKTLLISIGDSCDPVNRQVAQQRRASIILQ